MNFKECSLSWVAPLNVFLLGNNFNLTFLKLYMFENFNFKESEKEKKTTKMFYLCYRFIDHKLTLKKTLIFFVKRCCKLFFSLFKWISETKIIIHKPSVKPRNEL